MEGLSDLIVKELRTAVQHLHLTENSTTTRKKQRQGNRIVTFIVVDGLTKYTNNNNNKTTNNPKTGERNRVYLEYVII